MLLVAFVLVAISADWIAPFNPKDRLEPYSPPGRSHVLGTNDLRSDVLPNIIHVVLPKFMLAIATAMISEASLAFLGLGDPGAKSWGMMINLAFQKGGLINGMWWWFLPPGMCITLVVVSIVLMSFPLEREEVTGVGLRR